VTAECEEPTCGLSGDARQAKIGRILFVMPSVQLGGMETHCVDLTAEFTRRGIAVAALIPRSPALDRLEARFHTAGASTRRLDLDARHGRLAQLRSWPVLLRAMRSWQPDVVHVHTGGPSGGISLIAAARCGTHARVILTEHEVPSSSLPRRQRAFRSWMDRWSHALVAVSRRNAALRMELLGAPLDRFAVVLNGVPVDQQPSATRDQNRQSVRLEYAIAQCAVVIGSVVRLVEGKGLHDLIRAFALVAHDKPVELLLVGDGPLRGQLEDLAVTLSIRDRVHLVGHQDEPGRFIDAMDMFVLAVPAGSMSIALLEAMSRGVTSAITFCGPEEAVIPEETGLAAPPNDPEGLAHVLIRGAADSALRRRLGASGAAHVRRHFSVQRAADDLLDIYRAARVGGVPTGLRFDAPPNPRPGDRV
jgi:L-malate glycosyltransferase